MLYMLELDGKQFGNLAFHTFEDAKRFLVQSIQRAEARYARATQGKKHREMQALKGVQDRLLGQITVVRMDLSQHDVRKIKVAPAETPQRPRYSSVFRSYLEVE